MGLFEPIKIYGRVGDVEAARGRNQDSQSHRNLNPSSKYGELILIVSELRSKKDSELMDVAFQTLEYSVYGKAIKENFRIRSGETLYQKLNNWKVSFLTGRHSFLEGIKKEIIKNHDTFHSFGGKAIDVSTALRMYRPSFRTAPFNLDEMIAIGGIQEIEVNREVCKMNQGMNTRITKGTFIPNDIVSG
ncbi:MAG TPA: hypothetical protein VF691_00910 [Cytophagaceae bacterium]|jgi:hypothetical protein